MTLTRNKILLCAFLAANPHLPFGVLKLLTDDKYCWAGNLTTPPDILRGFAEYSLLRSYVAGNTSTPVEVLEKLSQDNESSVRVVVAENTSTPVWVLEELARRDMCHGVRMMANSTLARVRGRICLTV